MVVSEGEDGTDGPDEVAEEDVEAVVPEIGEPRGGDVDACEPGDDGQYEEVDGWRGGLVACGDQGVIVARGKGVGVSLVHW